MAADPAGLPGVAREVALRVRARRQRPLHPVELPRDRCHGPHAGGDCVLRVLRVHGVFLLAVHEPPRLRPARPEHRSSRGPLPHHQGAGNLPGVPLRLRHARRHHRRPLPPLCLRPHPPPRYSALPQPGNQHAARRHLRGGDMAGARLPRRRRHRPQRPPPLHHLPDHTMDARRLPPCCLHCRPLARPLPPLFPPHVPRPAAGRV
mmetsp:Transcript_28439/g.58174  ORF Transcript_28439/g.58174 Transcript_28439/m.58174 type:complete len:205 (-) Transcript_28439:57-671(-)